MLHHLFSMDGRVNRAPYLWHSILDTFVVIALVTAVLFLSSLGRGAPTGFGLFAAVGVFFAGMYSEIAITVKRLHDLDRPGWHWWLFVIPFYNIYLGFTLAFGRGTDGPNGFGTDPLTS